MTWRALTARPYPVVAVRVRLDVELHVVPDVPRVHVNAAP